MKILIAEDDPTSCRVLESLLKKWGYEVTVTRDGDEAWNALEHDTEHQIAILDWMMPGKDGVEVCRLARAQAAPLPRYLVLLTAKGETADIVSGLSAGADDYITKPFDRNELSARLKAGQRIVELQTALANRVRDLETALAEIKTLQGLLPICAYCKKIRDDKDYWNEIETYIGRRAGVRFSHGVCPKCYETIVKPEIEALNRDRDMKSQDGQAADGNSGEEHQ